MATRLNLTSNNSTQRIGHIRRLPDHTGNNLRCNARGGSTLLGTDRVSGQVNAQGSCSRPWVRHAIGIGCHRPSRLEGAKLGHSRKVWRSLQGPDTLRTSAVIVSRYRQVILFESPPSRWARSSSASIARRRFAKLAIVGCMSESSREHGRTKQHHVYLRRLLVAASVDIRANCICSTVTMCAAL